MVKKDKEETYSFIKQKVITDRQIIEKGFKEFEINCTISEEEMKKEFGKYDWGCKLD